MQPGANSSWNGNSFAQPNRMLPTNVPPQDLTQAYRQPVVNSLGQQVPGSQVSSPPSQFGTASQFDTRYQPPEGLPLNSQQQYQVQQRTRQQEIERQLGQQRMQVNQQLNQSMQAAWNQRRMNLHTPAPSAPALLTPAEHGGMIPVPTSSNGVNSARDSYRSNQVPPTGASQYIDQNRRASGQYQGQNGQGQYGQQQNFNQEIYYNAPQNQNVVVPAPYHTTSQPPRQQNSNYSGGVIQSSYTQPANPQTSASAYHSRGSQFQSNSGLPKIVPGSP